MSVLHETIDQLRRKIGRYGKSGVNEQNTKATLIQPILRALGWDVEDLDDVHLEYKQKGRDKPVDYALLLLRTPCLFLEAKSLGESLDDRKWANQVMGYASVAGVQWVVLTDGDEYRVYNSHATVPVEEKLFRKIRISDESTCPEKMLLLLSKEQMQERQINRLWDAHFIDRQIRDTLQKLIDNEREPDPSLVRLLNRRLPTLSPTDIRSGLKRLEVAISCPLTDDLALTPSAKRQEREKRRKKSRPRKQRLVERRKIHVGVALRDLVDAGLVTEPLRLFRKYKGRVLEAMLKLTGVIDFQGHESDSCSTAAGAARGSIIGGLPSTNGWTFWQYKASDGSVKQLDYLRRLLIEKRSLS